MLRLKSKTVLTQRQLFLHHVAQTSDAPLALEIESAEGMFLKTVDNEHIMDLIAGISVSVLGHRPPSVQKAVEAQLNKYWHTLVYGEFILAPQVQLATLLTKLLPPSLNSVYFTNSGSHRGRDEIGKTRHRSLRNYFDEKRLSRLNARRYVAQFGHLFYSSVSPVIA